MLRCQNCEYVGQDDEFGSTKGADMLVCPECGKSDQLFPISVEEIREKLSDTRLIVYALRFLAANVDDETVIDLELICCTEEAEYLTKRLETLADFMETEHAAAVAGAGKE
jgi:hypothetical protein